MLVLTLRDLQWRLRRFVIAGAGAALVFSMTLLLAGLTASFPEEAGRTVSAIGADTWVVRGGVDGAFTTLSAVPGSVATQIAREPGVRRADPIIVLHHTVHWLGRVIDINLVGYRPGGLGSPEPRAGRLPAAPDELVADTSLGARVGEPVSLAGRRFVVVGSVSGRTINGGQPLVFLRLRDAQQLLVQGFDAVTAVVTRGVPRRVPAGYTYRTRGQTREDLLRPLSGAISSLRLTQLLLWLVAGLVVGSVVYLSALERGRDFAVAKATGWSSGRLGAGLALQAVLLSVAAALLGIAVAQALLPLFPLHFGVPARDAVALPVVAAVVGLAACVAGLRRALGIDPALAFGSAT